MVLVLVDQLRADAVQRSMPRVHALSLEGVVFTNMRAAAPWTYPSVISMFSGLYPQQHGANGSRYNYNELSIFSSEVPLLPLLLKDSYYTAGFVTNPFLQKWNPLHLGFDHYAVDEFIGDQGSRRGHGSEVWTDRMFGDSVNAAVIEHFDSRVRSENGPPEFTYVHYIDVHGPWKGAPFDVGGAYHGNTEDRAYGIAAAYIDERIAELYEYFLARYEGDLLFAVTSDHGQELGDDLKLGHKYLPRVRKATVHDFNTRIPFLFLPSDRVPSSLRLELACSNVDIGPTLLAWAGLRSPVKTPGVNLVPAILGEPFTQSNRPIYSVRDAFEYHNDCVVIGDRKYTRYFSAISDRVVHEIITDHALDPDERVVVGYEFGDEKHLILRAAKTHGVRYPAVFEEPEEELKSKLQDIGYLGDE